MIKNSVLYKKTTEYGIHSRHTQTMLSTYTEQLNVF
jgi:hypothetical protein